MKVGNIVTVSKTFGGFDTGTITNTRRCPVLLRDEYLVEFQDGGQGWYSRHQLEVADAPDGC